MNEYVVADTLEVVLARERVREVQASLLSLPDWQYRVVRMVALDGMPHEEAAKWLQISPISCRNALWMARTAMKKYLAKRGYDIRLGGLYDARETTSRRRAMAKKRCKRGPV
jgi:DNA-directed RNA polymerase specialized sigma24 family protein